MAVLFLLPSPKGKRCNMLLKFTAQAQAQAEPSGGLFRVGV